MTNIAIYDTDAENIEKIADANNMTIAEVIELLMDYSDEMIKDNNLK